MIKNIKSINKDKIRIIYEMKYTSKIKKGENENKFSSLPCDELVWMESRVKELAKLSCLSSVNGVRVVGISGIGK